MSPDQRARVECLQIQRSQVELPMRFGIRGEQHLKATIQQESIDVIGTHPAADVIGRLDDLEASASLMDHACCGQAR